MLSGIPNLPLIITGWVTHPANLLYGGISMQAPWERPRVKRILELFGGRVVKIQAENKTQKEVKVDEAEIPR
jgi:hypothetical protein